jgi:hypothetical protein
MTTLEILWWILGAIWTVICAVAVAAWWLRGQTKAGEIAGLKEQIRAHEVWRDFAEAQNRSSQEQLFAALSPHSPDDALC